MGESTDSIVLKQLQTLYSVGAIGGLSDAQLGDRIRGGRDDNAEAAFTILAERHGPMVLRVCRQTLGDRHEADDAFQATFLVLARKAHAIRNKDSVAGWLHGVARRVALRARADSARRQIKERMAANLAIAQAPGGHEAQVGESWVELHEEIARLPERYREPIVLCYLEGLTTEAAAQRLGCPQGTVLSRLSRAKDRLRRSLTRRGVAGPAGMLAAGWGSDLAVPVPAALLETTVRTSLNFAARHAIGASLASTTAVGLARGVLYAMTLSQWKTIGAATLACVLATGGLQAFAQFGGMGVPDEAATAKPVADDRQAALSRSVAKIQAKLDQVTLLNTELQKDLQTIQAELAALRAGSALAPVKESKPNTQPTEPLKPAEGQAENIPNGGVDQNKYIRQDKTIFAVSPLGDKIKTYDTETKKTRSLQLPASREFPLEVTPNVGQNAAALMIKGPKITRIAASRSINGRWVTQDLREPVNGQAMPIVGPGVVVYNLGHYIYAFSPEVQRWDILELPKGIKASVMVGLKTATIVSDNHIYTFDITTAKWNDLNLRAILDTPDDIGPENAKPDQP